MSADFNSDSASSSGATLLGPDGVVKSTTALVFVTGCDHRYTYVNEAYAEYLHRSPGEIIGRTHADFYPRELAEAFVAANDEIMLKGKTVGADEQVMDRDMLSIKSPIRGADETVVGLSGVIIDITERKTWERELRNSEERYCSVITAMSEGVVLQAANGEIIANNARAEEILELTHEQMIGKTSVDLDRRTLRSDGSPFPGDEHPAMVTLRTGRPCRNQVMGIKTGDKTTRWININTEPLFHPPEHLPYAVVATFSDITLLKDNEQKLEASERRLHHALEIGEFGIWEVDSREKCVYCSTRHLRIFGLDQVDPDWSYEKFISYVLPDDRPEVERITKAVKSNEGVKDFVCRIRRQDGAIRWIHLWRELCLGADGQLISIRGIIRDVTQRKEEDIRQLHLERAAQQSRRLESLASMSAGIAHDFNNIFGSIAGAAELLELSAPADTSTLKKTGIIRSGIHRAVTLTNGMLDFAGTQRRLPAPVSISDLIAGYEGELRAALAKGILMRLALEQDLPPVMADADQIQLLVMNLVINGSEACRGRDGQVVIKTGMRRDFTPMSDEGAGLSISAHGDYVCLEVVDTGCGMNEATRARIFIRSTLRSSLAEDWVCLRCWGLFALTKGPLQRSPKRAPAQRSPSVSRWP